MAVDVEGGVGGDAVVLEPADEVEEGVGGVDVHESVVFEVECQGDSALVGAGFGVHSPVVSVTAARAEDSSTMFLLLA